jgi:hypothetical protein
VSFVRRFNFFPTVQQITLIEGVIIVDLPPPGAINGVNGGQVACVGEFADMTYGVSVSGGVVSTAPNPTQVFSSQDYLNKAGPFDEFLGDFGNAGGSGFVALRNKIYTSLVIVPVNLASAQAVRYIRQLPTNISATQPQPVVPGQGAVVLAGKQFQNGSNRVRNAGRVAFTNFGPYVANIDGNVVPTGLPAATQVFSIGLSVGIGGLVRTGGNLVTATVAAVPSWIVAGVTLFIAPGEANFPAGPVTVLPGVTGTTFTFNQTGSNVASTAVEYLSLTSFKTANNGQPVQVGDMLVLGVLSGGGALGTDAGTYRVNAFTDTGDLVIEQLNGSNFTASNWVAGAALPWRLQPATDGDTGGQQIFSAAAGFTVPARPLDATIPANTQLPPTIIPPAPTASTWDPLSGLTMITQAGGLTFTAAVQGPNAVNAAAIDTLYSTAINAMLSEQNPAHNTNVTFAARHSANIRSALRTLVDQRSALGRGMTTILSPEFSSVNTTSAAIGATDPGAGGNRDERVSYGWPGGTTFVPEAVGFTNIKGADGNFYTNGILDTHLDGWIASIYSNLAPERNPAQESPPVTTVLAPITGIQRNVTTPLAMNDYIAYRQNGIMALKIDADVGPIIQSGVTTSLVANTTNVNRRRMADFIEDSLAVGLKPISKLPLTQGLQDAATEETTTFLNTLLSPDNPAAQRIQAFAVDDISGNTPDLTAQGVFVIIVQVQMLATADFIVIQAQVGNGTVQVKSQ